MDNAFSSKYNSEAKNYYGDKDDFVSKMNIARDNAVRNAYGKCTREHRHDRQRRKYQDHDVCSTPEHYFEVVFN